jgi:glycosyltransferase involved in cell wall biosynthesis
MRLIYHGHPRIVPDDEAASRFRKRHGLNGEYFLANSKFVPYSNLHKLIEGYGAAVRLTPDLPKLVVAGGDASSSYKRMVLETIRTNGLSDKVLLAGLIPHTANLALMRSAKLFLFASLLEACPNTLIEALTEGCVILSSNRPPMREVAGDAVVYFDPLDPANIATRIVEASRMSGQEITSIRAAAIQRSRQFTWLESATRLRKVLEEAATQASARG